MTQYIFLDESGDLGFNPRKKNSKYFIVTVLFTANKAPIEKIAKKVHKNLRKKVKKLSGGVLHSVKEKPSTRVKLLTLLSQSNCFIMAIYLKKAKVYTHLQDEKHLLYNYVANILLDRIATRKLLNTNTNIILVAAKRETNKFLNANFKNYLEAQLNNRHKLILKIEIKTPNEEKALQVVDFASWAIFRKYEHDDKYYYDLIKKSIVEERGLFS
ncbi:hypothetical protein A2773_05845 [Candidatus Gottesmanbacteria bacterium RIFCSPHIGHO2_01_FULL_39_10]|uniref:DUF3800 domain-containing protein n=1 Tax=Candidatus Gottesmanbacteria bacterium RIFCSPHIGHO2_01_FULL_39_10 TaxID=1798375 RepID=A0A1F5ZKY5_9BACT|nr:MAG: hypothetical protein A2773_05845 [Candidatus Gottesmanbacteria bacterium RIFCSPHIGHO2_01_FULL_39_10]